MVIFYTSHIIIYYMLLGETPFALFIQTGLCASLCLMFSFFFSPENFRGGSKSSLETKNTEKDIEDSSLLCQKPEDKTQAAPYALDFTHDDLRNGSFQFIESQSNCFC